MTALILSSDHLSADPEKGPFGRFVWEVWLYGQILGDIYEYFRDVEAGWKPGRQKVVKNPDGKGSRLDWGIRASDCWPDGSGKNQKLAASG